MEQPVADLFRPGVTGRCKGHGEPAKPVVEALVAALDQPIGVEQRGAAVGQVGDALDPAGVRVETEEQVGVVGEERDVELGWRR